MEQKINIKVFKMFDDVELPVYATPYSSCFDLRAYIPKDEREKPLMIYPGETKLIHTGLKMGLPRGWEIQIRPRSGMSLKTKFRVANAPGTIDSDYLGEICVVAENIKTDLNVIFDEMCDAFCLKMKLDDNKDSLFIEENKKAYAETNAIRINHGDRICQAALQPVFRPDLMYVVDTWDEYETIRGAGGFGSSGIK